MQKTWIQKLEDKKSFPKVLKLEKRFPCYNAVYKMGANPGGLEGHKKRLEKEGHKVIARGKKYQVAEYEKYLDGLNFIRKQISPAPRPKSD